MKFTEMFIVNSDQKVPFSERMYFVQICLGFAGSVTYTVDQENFVAN